MTGFPALAAIETKLLARDPGALFSMVIPLFILIVFASGTQPGDTTVPTMALMIGVALVGLYMVPTALATYRERGILRRMSATPVSPAALLSVQLLLQLVFSVISSALLVAVSGLVFGAAWPGRLLPFTLIFLLGATSLFAIGLLIAALADSGRTANGVGVLLYFPLAFLGGLMLPKDQMPGFLATIGEFTPLGAFRQAIDEAWRGVAVQPASLGIMAAYALIVGFAAVRFFRWE